MKSIEEVIRFLDGCVGQSVDSNCGVYKGQCVSLIKSLLNFIGAPDPYKARGDAKDAGNRYISDGVAENRKGILNVCISKATSSNPYGHIWVDIDGVANWEQNGARSLLVTKNTRPLNQAAQIVCLDKWLNNSNGNGGIGMFGCIVWADDDHYGLDKGTGCLWTPSTGVIPLESYDCIGVLNMISQHYTGKNLPEIHSSSAAPWVARLNQDSIASPYSSYSKNANVETSKNEILTALSKFNAKEDNNGIEIDVTANDPEVRKEQLRADIATLQAKLDELN